MLVTKWKHISEAIMANVHYDHDYDKPVCKDNGGPFYEYYGKIHNYISGIGHNEKYWDIFAKNKVIAQKLEQIILEFVDMFMLIGVYAYQARPKMAIQESIFCDFGVI